MACIFAGILSLTQHLSTLKNSPEAYCIDQCPHPDCGKSGLWGHGFRYRKSDREHDEPSTLNPIPIQRLYCPSCKRTCSVLPACIPPWRWYLWLIQEEALRLYLSGQSFNKISQCIKPSRWTISRWLIRLKEQFKEHALHLKSRWSDLGYHQTFNDFWSAALNKIRLSQSMVFLNNQNVFVP
jgi:transposase-like protein